MIKRIISILLITFMLITVSAIPALSATVELDEETFNQIVTRAKEADVLEKEVDFYKQKLDQVIDKAKEVQSAYKDLDEVQDNIIAEQIRLSGVHKDIIKSQYDTIGLQDKKIVKLETKNFIKDVLVVGLTAGGVKAASDGDNDGLAIGIGVAGLAYLVFTN
jgi:hypothetical protein